MINDHFSAHQGVEDDDLNVLCLGGRVTGEMAAKELLVAFLNAKFTGEEPGEQVREDLRHFKMLMESGQIISTQGQPSGRK